MAGLRRSAGTKATKSVEYSNEFERIRSLPNRVAYLIATTQNDRAELFRIQPSMDETDVRAAIYAKALNGLIPAHLSLYLLSEQMLDSAWWSSRDVPFYEPDGIAIILEEFENSIKANLILGLFQAYESSFRRMLDELAPSLVAPHPPFKKVYDRLFKLTRIPDRPSAVNTFDLLRNLRNSVHTNTVYHSKTGEDLTLAWKGDDLEFKHGFPITFLTWELLPDLLDECRKVATSVIHSQAISSLPGVVADLYSYEPSD